MAGFGPELRRHRRAAGMSLADLAIAVHYSKGHLSKIENGKKSAGNELPAQCDAVLGAGGRLVAAARAAVPVPAPAPENAPPPTRGRALAAAAGDTAALPAFETMFVQQRLLGRSVSPGVVLPGVTTEIRTLRTLAATAPEAARTALLLLAARCAEYAGWMAQEAGDDRGALSWTASAARMAESGGDRELARYAMVRQAELALYRGDVQEALTLAVHAQAGGRAPRVTGLAFQREAQGYALAGDRYRWQRAMEQATELLSATDEDPSALGAHSAPNLQALVTGWCLFDLGRPEEAAETFDREMPLVPDSARRAAARFGVRQAMAHAAAGDPGGAAALVPALLALAMQVDSATIRMDLRRLWRELARWEHRPEIARARTELADALLPY